MAACAVREDGISRLDEENVQLALEGRRNKAQGERTREPWDNIGE